MPFLGADAEIFACFLFLPSRFPRKNATTPNDPRPIFPLNLPVKGKTHPIWVDYDNSLKFLPTLSLICFFCGWRAFHFALQWRFALPQNREGGEGRWENALLCPFPLHF